MSSRYSTSERPSPDSSRTEDEVTFDRPAPQSRPSDEDLEERNPVDALADEFTARLRAGETPSIDEFVRRLPEQEAAIRVLFPSIAMMERAARPENRARSDDGRLDRIVADGTQMLGDFLILREIGRGGMGIVYEAIQQSLRRRVALKVIVPAIADSRRQLERFRREAEAAARLHHTNIVPVFGIGEENGLHYYAMQLIDGVPLNEVINAVRRNPGLARGTAGPMPFDQNANRSRAFTPADAVRILVHGAALKVSGGITEVREAMMPPTSAADGNDQIGLSKVDPVDDELAATIGYPAESEERDEGRSGWTVADRSDDEAGCDRVSGLERVTFVDRGLDQPQVIVAAGDGTALDPTGRTGVLPDSTDSDRCRSKAGARSSSQPENNPESIKELPETYFRSIAQVIAQVADALSYSHQHGVLHRDIKPSNLMLDRNGEVWITDFGLARNEDREGITQTGDIVGTLRYMAPEQFHGQTDARSDVCSLGLTLYELLTLRPACTESRHGPLIAAKTQTMPPAPRTLNPAIPADLETITLKACATTPVDRYQTATQLAEDLRRYLEDRPISARPITPIERLRRWTRRNPALASLSFATFTLLLSVAVVFAVGQYQTQRALDQAKLERTRAETNLTLAIQAFEEVMDNISARGMGRSLAASVSEDDIAISETVLTAADVRLLETLLTFFDRFANENQDSTRIDTAAARRRVGDIQQRLGRFIEADSTYRKAREAYLELSKQAPDEASLVIAQAALTNEMGIAASRRGALQEAATFHREARSQLKASPQALSTVEGRFELARALSLLSSTGDRAGLSTLIGTFRPDGPPRPDREREFRPRYEPGRLEIGRPEGERAEEHRGPERRPFGPDGEGRPRPGDGPRERRGDERRDGPPDERRPDSRGFGPDPRSFDRPRGFEPGGREIESHLAEINAASDEAIQLLNGLSEDAPENMDYRLALARTWRNRALISHMRRDPEQAERALQTSIRELEELVQSHPESTTLMFELADALCMNLPIPPGRDRNESAGSRIDQAMRLCGQLMEVQPGNPEYQALFALALSRKAGTLRDAEPAAARDLWRQALPLQQSLVEQFPTVTQYRIACAQSLAGIAETESRLGNRTDAMNRFDEAIRLLENGSLDEDASDFLLRLAEQLRHMKQRFAAPGERPPGPPRPAPQPRLDASPERP